MYLTHPIPTPAQIAISAAPAVSQSRPSVASPALSQQALTAGLSQAEIRQLVLDIIG